MMDVNLDGVFHTMQVGLAKMMERRKVACEIAKAEGKPEEQNRFYGRVITMASQAGEGNCDRNWNWNADDLFCLLLCGENQSLKNGNFLLEIVGLEQNK